MGSRGRIGKKKSYNLGIQSPWFIRSFWKIFTSLWYWQGHLVCLLNEQGR